MLYDARMMRWLVVSMLVAVVGCTKPNPRSCIDGSCSDPNFPFCDVSGQFGEGANTCLAVTCDANAFVACSGDTALVCNAVGNNYDPHACGVSCDATKGCIDCLVDNDCGAAAPHCDGDGSCVECLDSTQCADPSKPFCDDSLHACRGCSIDDECDSKVCDDTSGSCVDSSKVIYAAPDGILFDCGTLAVPCSFQGAVDQVDGTRTVIKLLPGTYAETVTARSKVFAVHGDGATLHPADTAAAGLTVTNGDATVTVVGMAFERGVGAGANAAITCNADSSPARGNVVLDRVSVTVPQNGVTLCKATVTRSSFKATTATPGVLLFSGTISRSRFEGGRVQMPTVGPSGFGDFAENCLFINTQVESGTDAAVRFSTLINSVVLCGQTGSPQPNRINLTDDIMVSTSAIETGVCDHHHVVAMPAPLPGGTNDNVTTEDPRFVNAAAGDYHLMPGSPAIDAADPTATSTTDYDGKPRPIGAGKDIGAFEFKP